LRRALVTGGSGDIGGAICRRLAADGCFVVVHGHRHPERAEAVADEIRRQGGGAASLVFDVTDGDATALAIRGLLDAGPIQVLVNNAGTFDDAPLAGMSFDQWRRVIDVNLHGFFHVTQPLILPMVRSRWGRIVTVTSVSAIIGNRGQTNYAAAKAALHGATRSLALELASRRITVNAVAPGLVAGHITDQVFDAAAIRRLVPMQRAGTPEEVAAVVGFLASDAAAYVSGQVVSVNGFMA
jgi:3-oxoacyl-[acyl-carrier protein] reductase